MAHYAKTFNFEEENLWISSFSLILNRNGRIEKRLGWFHKWRRCLNWNWNGNFVFVWRKTERVKKSFFFRFWEKKSMRIEKNLIIFKCVCVCGKKRKIWIWIMCLFHIKFFCDNDNICNFSIHLYSFFVFLYYYSEHFYSFFYIFSDDYIYDTTYKSKIVIFLETLTRLRKSFFKEEETRKWKRILERRDFHLNMTMRWKKVKERKRNKEEKMFELNYVWEMRKK